MSLFNRSFPRQAVTKSEIFQDINSLEQSLWRRCELEHDKMGGARNFVCLIGFCEPDLAGVLKLLHDFGVDKTALFSDISEFYKKMKSNNNSNVHLEGFSHIFINLDSFSSLENGINILLRFRKIFKLERIILTSEYSVSNDFGNERSSICDATLSLPLSSKALCMVINSV